MPDFIYGMLVLTPDLKQALIWPCSYGNSLVWILSVVDACALLLVPNLWHQHVLKGVPPGCHGNVLNLHCSRPCVILTINKSVRSLTICTIDNGSIASCRHGDCLILCSLTFNLNVPCNEGTGNMTNICLIENVLWCKSGQSWERIHYTINWLCQRAMPEDVSLFSLSYLFGDWLTFIHVCIFMYVCGNNFITTCKKWKKETEHHDRVWAFQISRWCWQLFITQTIQLSLVVRYRFCPAADLFTATTANVWWRVCLNSYGSDFSSCFAVVLERFEFFSEVTYIVTPTLYH